MLRNTFIHLPGVGTHRERTLWKQGILDWHAFLVAAEGDQLPQGHLSVCRTPGSAIPGCRCRW